MRILIVEDEKRLATTLADLLKRQGYSCDISLDGIAGLDNARSGIYDLLLLDAMLPGMDGFTLLQQLRSDGSSIPVLMLTAKSELGDRIRGLESGADYYLTKPFEPTELLACVHTLLRRQNAQAIQDNTLRYGDLILDCNTFQLVCDHRDVRLSRHEYDIMELLIKNGTQIVSKEQILNKVWGFDSEAEDNNVEVYVSFLRRKLSHIHSAVKIKTLRMIGYCLEEHSND